MFCSILDDAKDDEALYRLQDAVSNHHFRSMDSLATILDWHKHSEFSDGTLSDYISQDLEPILTEVIRLEMLFSIKPTTYLGIEIPFPVEECLNEESGAILTEICEQIGLDEAASQEMSQAIRAEIMNEIKFTGLLAEYKKTLKHRTKDISFLQPNGRIELNKKNGRVMIGEKVIDRLDMSTDIYRFFEKLYDNLDIPVSHDQIAEHLGMAHYDTEKREYVYKWSGKSIGDRLAGIKYLLSPELNALITTVTRGYMLDTMNVKGDK